jgi:hypothetical protein
VSGIGPEQAILEDLARPIGRAQFGPPGPSGVRAGFIEGGHWCEADLQTVRFVKFRETPRRRLYFVTYEGSLPDMPGRHRFSELYPVERTAEGSWQTTGGAGGGDEDMARPEPWVNLAGGGWRELEPGVTRALPDRFYAGGRVHGAGVEVARVQLRFDDGAVLEDDTDQVIVLFITDQAVRLPATAVLLDRAGQQVATYPFPGV